MRIHLLAVGARMPTWVKAGFADYAERLPRECSLELVEIPAGKGGGHTDLNRRLREEGERLLAAAPRGAEIVALDSDGQQWSSEELADQLDRWLRGGRDVALLIGGPDGLSDACRARADRIWSLSRLTLPHALARILAAEQIYRAWSILQRHPYHRA